MVVLARRPPANNYTRRDAGDLAGAIDVLALALRELSVGPTAETVARAVPELARSGVADLSQRERQVLVLLAQGLTSAEIAARLYLSPRTVEWHRAKILHKLDRPTRAQLIALGLSLRD
jgi:DNA-binding CsgD family transcriptional regulator